MTTAFLADEQTWRSGAAPDTDVERWLARTGGHQRRFPAPPDSRTAPSAHRPKFLEVLRGEVGQDRLVYLILAECSLILPEAQAQENLLLGPGRMTQSSAHPKSDPACAKRVVKIPQ
jgi:hypothetical protein